MGHDLNPLLLLLPQVALILALSRMMGWIFHRLGQPQVVGEMTAGIMLGPSLLGLVWPGAFDVLFPAPSIASLNVLSQVGVVLFLFLVGLEFDVGLVRRRGRAAAAVSAGSILTPFVLGVGLTFFLYPRLFDDPTGERFVPAALFMGAAISVTAFPVLARILTERNIHKTPVGAISITCAAVNDVLAWCLLAVVVAVARYQGWQTALWTAAGAAIYLAVMFLLVRPFTVRLEHIYGRQGRLGQNLIALIFLMLLASAWATEAIGIHALFGAFVLGCVMPKGSHFVQHLSDKLEDFTVVFLLPLFFAYTGLRTDLTQLFSGMLWGPALLIVAVAVIGKFGGAAVVARLFGFAWRESAAIGVLMNTRGLMELVILSIGLELGVINASVFAMMVLMALVTTAMTAPGLHLLYPARVLAGMVPVAPPARRVETLLIPVADPTSGARLVRLAALLGERDRPARVVALHLRRPDESEAYRADVGAPEPQDDVLTPLLSEAAQTGLSVEPLSFMSRDVADDIATVARMQNARLVLIGFHKPLIGHALLGGTVHRIMTDAPADVAVFVDRGLATPQRILVPYLGTPHDRLAMELAGRIGRSTGAQLTVLHVVPPGRQAKLGAREDVDRVLPDPSQPAPVHFKVVHTDEPIDTVLAESADADLLVVGAGEEWDLESRLVNLRPQRIARETNVSLLIVRKFAARAVPSVGTDPTPQSADLSSVPPNPASGPHPTS